MNKLTTTKKRRVQITLSEKSYKTINHRAEEIGVPLQEYIRHKLLYNPEDYIEQLTGEDEKQFGEAVMELKNDKNSKPMTISELLKDLKK